VFFVIVGNKKKRQTAGATVLFPLNFPFRALAVRVFVSVRAAAAFSAQSLFFLSRWARARMGNFRHRRHTKIWIVDR